MQFSVHYVSFFHWVGKFCKDGRFLEKVHINDHAIEKTAHFYAKFKKVDNELEWARNIVQMIDYTTLTCENTESSITYHCMKAFNPLPDYSFDVKGLRTAAVCIYPSRVPEAASVLQRIDHDRDVQIAAGNLRLTYRYLHFSHKHFYKLTIQYIGYFAFVQLQLVSRPVSIH